MIKAVIFDLWKTLGTKNISVSGEFCRHFSIEKTPGFMPRYEESIQLEKWESMEQMAHHMLEYFSLETNEENVRFIIDVMDKGEKGSSLFPGMKELLTDIHRTCKLALLSNTAVFEARHLAKWGVEELFDAVVYSWQIKSLKPARKNFEAVLEKLGLPAEECLFVDDNDKNIAAAKEMGFHVVKSEGVEKLREDLRKLGVRV